VRHALLSRRSGPRRSARHLLHRSAYKITCIPGVTGDWRHAGGGVHYDTRGLFGLDWAALWRDDLRPREARCVELSGPDGECEFDRDCAGALRC
jgi:hypothetical protein